MSLLGFLFGPGLNAAADRLVGLGFLSVLVQGSSTTLVIALGRARRADDAGPGCNASCTFLPGEADAADDDGASRAAPWRSGFSTAWSCSCLPALNSASCCRASATPISPPARCR
jgi:hypothetical protein